MYITSGIEAAPHDAHFVLHGFKTKDLQPLNANLKGIDVMGEVRYEVSVVHHTNTFMRLPSFQ